jgi:5'-3' exonuclease
MRYLLIDLSYYVFYRYYAIVNYIKLSTKTVPNLDNVLENEQFITKFEEMFEKTLCKLVKEHYDIKNLKLATDLQIILVKDCSRANIWRLKQFPLYKACRDHSKKKDMFDGMIFEYVYKVILPKLINKYYCIHDVYVDNVEADDCIAVITNCLTGKENEIIIITNDNDYLQLMDRVNGIFNLQGKNLNAKLFQGCCKKSLLCKVLMGDPSDNIKGVLSKAKATHILTTCEDVENIESYLTDQQKITYNFNKQLIDFNYIPSHLQDNIRSAFYNHTFINSDLCFCKSSI